MTGMIARLGRVRLPGTARSAVIRAAHRLLLARMRLEAWAAGVLGSRRPRIVVTACWKFPIYSQTFVYQETEWLRRNGFDVRFLYSEASSRDELADDFGALWRLKRRLLLTDLTSRDDFAYYQARMPERVAAVIERLARASGLTEAELTAHPHVLHAFSFARMVEAWRADYLHSYFFYERTLFALVAASLLQIPRGVSCYSDHLLEDYELKVVPLHLQTCDIVVATSARVKGELERLGRGLADDRIIVKHNAIDSTRFVAGPSRRSGGEGSCRLLFVARIDPKKGLTYLVDAVKLLADRGTSVELHVVGSADAHDPASLAYAREVEARIRAHGLESSVRLAGWKPSAAVRRELRASDVFVAPFVELPNGDKDGLPTAVLEAMAAGLAIVGTDAGSIPEVLTHDSEALLVPQRDAAALAEAIARLAGDAPLRERLGAAAMRRVRAQADVTRCESVFHDRIRAAVTTGRTVRAARVWA